MSAQAIQDRALAFEVISPVGQVKAQQVVNVPAVTVKPIIDTTVQPVDETLNLVSPILQKIAAGIIKPATIQSSINTVTPGTDQQAATPNIPVVPAANNNDSSYIQASVGSTPAITKTPEQIQADCTAAMKANPIIISPAVNAVLAQLPSVGNVPDMSKIPTAKTDDVINSAVNLMALNVKGQPVNLATTPVVTPVAGIGNTDRIGSSIATTNEPSTPLTVAPALTSTDLLNNGTNQNLIYWLLGGLLLLALIFKHKRK